MGDIVVHLRGNARTGRKEILIDYESDEDLTTAEHERRHRQIVELLVREGQISREEIDEVVIVRRQQEQTEGEQAAEGQG